MVAVKGGSDGSTSSGKVTREEVGRGGAQRMAEMRELAAH